MNKVITVFLFIGILLSCKNKSEEASKYYDSFNTLFLEFESNRQETISSGNKLLKMHYTSPVRLDAQDYTSLLNQYDNLVKICRDNIVKIELIRPFRQDTNLMYASKRLYVISEAIFKNEFPTYIKSIQKDEICNSCELNVQSALLKYIEVQKDLIKTEIEFQKRYNLDIKLKELEEAYFVHIKNIEKAKKVIGK